MIPVLGRGGSPSDPKAMSLQPARVLVLRIVLLRLWIKFSCHDPVKSSYHVILSCGLDFVA